MKIHRVYRRSMTVRKLIGNVQTIANNIIAAISGYNNRKIENRRPGHVCSPRRENISRDSRLKQKKKKYIYLKVTFVFANG